MRKIIFTAALLLSSLSLQTLADSDREEIKIILEGIVTGWKVIHTHSSGRPLKKK
jgi:hypothetical protein